MTADDVPVLERIKTTLVGLKMLRGLEIVNRSRYDPCRVIPPTPADDPFCGKISPRPVEHGVRGGRSDSVRHTRHSRLDSVGQMGLGDADPLTAGDYHLGQVLVVGMLGSFNCAGWAAPLTATQDRPEGFEARRSVAKWERETFGTFLTAY